MLVKKLEPTLCSWKSCIPMQPFTRLIYGRARGLSNCHCTGDVHYLNSRRASNLVAILQVGKRKAEWSNKLVHYKCKVKTYK